MPIRIAIAGAAGRMGRRLIALSSQDVELELAAALEEGSSPTIGQNAGELAGIGSRAVIVADQTDAKFDVLIDFSLPAGTMRWLDFCLKTGAGMVIGTTGHDEEQLARIRAASERIAILRAPNFSVGVTVMQEVAEMMARILDESYDVEISETHHRFKVDAPSGTALALRDAVTRGRAAPLASASGGPPAVSASSPPSVASASGGPSAVLGVAHPLPVADQSPAVVHGRAGHTGERAAGQIGMHSLRIGDVVGEHTVEFGTLGESLAISHTARSRDTFAAGALRAARWIAGKKPGLYGMADVLFGGHAAADRR